MRGTSRFKDGAWRLQVWDASRKKYEYGTVKAPQTKVGAKEADAKLRQLIDKVERGQLDIEITVTQLLDEWLAVNTSTEHWEPKTIDTNTRGVKHLVPLVGHRKLMNLRPTHIQQAYTDLPDTLGPASRLRIHGILHAALEQAKKWELIATNPASLVTPPTVKKRRNTTPSPAQLMKLLDGIDEQADFAAYARLASTTGARRGSVSALRWSNVDLDAGTVMYAMKVSMTTRGMVEAPGNKTGRVYQVSIGLDVNAALRRWRTEQRERVMQFGAQMPDDPYVFTSPVDPRQLRRPDHWTREWRRLRTSVDPTGGLDHIRLHDLKHYCATQLLAGGIPLHTVADRLGMATSLLVSLYGHAVPVHDQEAAELMDRLHRPG